MTAAALMYHDVIEPERNGASGFPGGDAARYKLPVGEFERHLDAIAARTSSPLLTFDDGGVSAMTIADALEHRGWRGHFFITTAYIDRAAFLSRAQLRELHRRGHVVGSHSHTHPLRLAACSTARILDEWRRSTNVLADVLGTRVATASVPGGHYSSTVARAAAVAGIETLFTSRPTHRVTNVEDVEVRGRWAIQRSTSAVTAAALAAGDWLPSARWAAIWGMKRACRAIGGAAYLKARARVLGGASTVQWGDDLPALSEDPS